MYRVATVIILILFYCIYYGKLISQKKKGIQTNQLKNQKNGVRYTVGTLMTIATLLVPMAEIIAMCFNVTYLPTYTRLIGIIFALLGDVLFYLSVTTMGSSWRAGVSETEKTQLITNGIYSISRNPAFLAFDLVYIGVLLMFFNWWLLLFTLFAIIMLHMQIVLVEEPFLPSMFGDEYVNYCHKVNRYIGRKF